MLDATGRTPVTYSTDPGIARNVAAPESRRPGAAWRFEAPQSAITRFRKSIGRFFEDEL